MLDLQKERTRKVKRLIMKELPINNNPFVRAYMENIFLDSIMNNDMTTGDCVAKINLSSYEKDEWKKVLNKANIAINGEDIEVEHYSYDSLSYIYRELHEIDELVFRIDYCQYTNRWNCIAIAISDSLSALTDFNAMTFGYGYYCSRNFFTSYGNELKYHNMGNKLDYPYVWMKMTKKMNRIECFYSTDKVEWIKLYEYENVSIADDSYVAILFSLQDNQYDKWIANNFIQTRFNRKEGKSIEYITLLKRDWRGYAVNPIVKISHDNMDVIKSYGINLWDYIKANIDNNIYIEFWLDEYYVDTLQSYHLYHFSHESLVYGYDENSKSVSIISLKMGKPYSSRISFNTLLIAHENANNNEICYKFQYNPTNSPYELSISHICEMLEDYLNGTNTSRKMEYMLPGEEGTYGIKVYDAILNGDEDQKTFFEDLRIVYLMYEHKKIMSRRVEYLNKRGYLKDVDFDELFKGIKELERLAEKIMNLTIKNKINSGVERQKKILVLLEAMKCNERRYFSILLSGLNHSDKR